jgi:glycosyltransferase involved in cell wall biosynthesis
MKILFVTIAWPETGRRNLYTDLMSEFSDRGHDVTVVCNTEKKNEMTYSFGIENGIQVLRIRTGRIKKAHIIQKALSLFFLSGKFKKGVVRYLSDFEFNLILFNTPPVTLSNFLMFLKKHYSASIYVLLKDMWPYGFVDFGLIKKGGPIYNYLRNHEKKVFKVADHIGCMSPKGVEFVISNNPDLEINKLEVCPNSIKIIEKELNNKNIDLESKVKAKYGIPSDATIFIFSGNIGLGHGIDFLLDMIIDLKYYKKAFFLIGGAGTNFSRAKNRLDSENLSNAYMYSFLPDQDFEELMSICDVGLILLGSKYKYPQFPSRLLGYLQDNLAILCSVNYETDIGDIVEKYGAGISTIHGDVNGFKSAVYRLCENVDETKKMGNNGFKLLKNRYSVDISYNVIMNHYI